MARRRLTDRSVRALKPAAANKRYITMDEACPGLGVRVNDQASKVFTFVGRFPGSRNPTRRAIGAYPNISLEEARKTGRAWQRLLADGVDPRAERQRREREELRLTANPFGTVAAAYVAHLQRKGLRSAAEVERYLDREFVPAWRDRPIGELTRADVLTVIQRLVNRGKPAAARNALAYVRSFFGWAVDAYGLESSPADRIQPKRLIGAAKSRTRVLNDEELSALWRATGRMSYPFAPLFRMLLLTGQRRSEVAEAQWHEFDLAGKMWVVPAARSKSGQQHLVPLSDDVLRILAELPRFKKGSFIFSTTFGERPVSGFSKIKDALDKRMLRTLRAMARKRGENPANVEMRPFVIHDLRRTVRTRLSSLRFPDEVAEAVIGHGRKGLQRVYDQHQRIDEMREAHAAWAARLRDIVEPSPVNVVPLRRKGRSK